MSYPSGSALVSYYIWLGNTLKKMWTTVFWVMAFVLLHFYKIFCLEAVSMLTFFVVGCAMLSDFYVFFLHFNNMITGLFYYFNHRIIVYMALRKKYYSMKVYFIKQVWWSIYNEHISFPFISCRHWTQFLALFLHLETNWRLNAWWPH